MLDVPHAAFAMQQLQPKHKTAPGTGHQTRLPLHICRAG